MKKAVLFGVSFVVAAGCGGGGGGKGSSETVGREFAFGTLTGRAAETNPPITSNSDAVVSTALTGIITSLRLTDQSPSPDELRIIFNGELYSTDAEIYSSNIDGTDLVRITNTPGASERDLAVSPKGDKIAFSAVGTGGDLEIFTINIDGSGRTQITNDAVNNIEPDWAPNGTSIVYTLANGAERDVEVINVSTKATTPLADDAFDNEQPEFTPDGQSVVFVSDRAGDGFKHLYRVPSAGGAISAYFSQASVNQLEPAFSPDGLFLAFYKSGASDSDIWYKPIGGDPVLGPAGQFYNWSPDSRLIAYTRFVNNKWRLFVSDRNRTNQRELFIDINANKREPDFIPVPREVQFVGAGTMFGSRLTGFIASQSGPATRSLVGFDCTTPSTMTMTKQTPSDTVSPNLVFSVDADTVTQIGFAHSPYWRFTKVVGGGTSVSACDGALVSIDSLTGKVVAVLPFGGVRSAKPTVSDEGSTRVFSGNFLGVFDGSGNNLGRADEVRLDVRSGQLSIR